MLLQVKGMNLLDRWTCNTSGSQSPASKGGGQGSIQGQDMRDLWWTKRHWSMFQSSTRFLLPIVITLLLHIYQPSIITILNQFWQRLQLTNVKRNAQLEYFQHIVECVLPSCPVFALDTRRLRTRRSTVYAVHVSTHYFLEPLEVTRNCSLLGQWVWDKDVVSISRRRLYFLFQAELLIEH